MIVLFFPFYLALTKILDFGEYRRVHENDNGLSRVCIDCLSVLCVFIKGLTLLSLH